MPANQNPPIVKSEMVLPFLRSARKRGVDPDEVLAGFGYSEASVAQEQYFSVITWYDLVDALAAKADDRYFGFKVGNESALSALPNLRTTLGHEGTLSDMISLLFMDARRHSNLGTHTITNDGQTATMRLNRSFKPPRKPSQIDAFGFGFMIRLMKSYVADSWKPVLVSIQISDPDALPDNKKHGYLISVDDDWSGPVYRFPSIWLFYSHGKPPEYTYTEHDIVGDDLVTAVRSVVKQHLQYPSLNESFVAQMTCGSVRSLQYRLSKAGTNYSALLNEIRQETSKALLRTDQSVAQISSKVGYANPPAFIRAFRKWTGYTPAKYRKVQDHRAS